MIFVGARLVLEILQKGSRTGGRINQLPALKMRLENTLKETSKDLAIINIMEGGLQSITSEIQRRYWVRKRNRLSDRGANVVSDTAAKIKGYSGTMNQLQVNHLFETDQKPFYESLERIQQDHLSPMLLLNF